MSSKISKLRKNLEGYAKEREVFESKRKELELEMAKGKQNMGKIRKGLRNNEIKIDSMLTVEVPDQEAARSEPLSESRKIGSRAANKRGISKNLLGVDNLLANSPLSSTKNTTLAIPSTALLSEWAFSGPVDSLPPVLKSQDLYEYVRLIGRGAFGTVDLVKNIDDNRLYATKTVLITEADSALEADALQEVKHMRINRHPGIIDLMDVYIISQPRVLHIVMTFCEAGDLAKTIQYAQKTHNLLPEAQLLKWISQLFMALHFLQENNTLHRDIKPSNILLTDNGEICKIADFGLATEVKDGRCKSLAEAGTPYYTSPEMVNNDPYSFPSDNWSLGVVIHELMRLQLPFYGGNTADLVRMIMNENPPPLPSHYSEEIRGISVALLRKDPVERLTMTTALQTPIISQKVGQFVHGYRPKMVEERQRRAQTRQLISQLERINSTPWPASIPLPNLPESALQPGESSKSSSSPTKSMKSGLSESAIEAQDSSEPPSARGGDSAAIVATALSDDTPHQNSASAPTSRTPRDGLLQGRTLSSEVHRNSSLHSQSDHHLPTLPTQTSSSPRPSSGSITAGATNLPPIEA